MTRRRTDCPSLRLPLLVGILAGVIWLTNAAPQTKELPMGIASSETPGVQKAAVAAPVQGVTETGRAYVLERNPKYPLVEFVMILTDERR